METSTPAARLRYYEGEDDLENTRILNSADNTAQISGNGGGRPVALSTPLFQVSGIVGVSLAGGNTAWVLVDDGMTSLPVPAAPRLFIYGVPWLIGVSRHKVAA
jgi:hypothetical protein